MDPIGAMTISPRAEDTRIHGIREKGKAKEPKAARGTGGIMWMDFEDVKCLCG